MNMELRNFNQHSSGNQGQDDIIFELIARDIEEQGYSIRPGALPGDIASVLYDYQLAMDSTQYDSAGIGRGESYIHNDFVRTDEICWIDGTSAPGQAWLEWAAALKTYLNRRLFLGLFSFESHFAHYSPGDFYKRHYDAFKGQANRVLSIVAYLNPGWLPSDGGELVIYNHEHDKEGIKVIPLYGTVVVFLSEEFPHEVLPANRDRYSVAGWFRLNSTTPDKVDPPR
jgi:SM-20-related protein